MPQVDSFEPGRFCWIDLSTSDQEAAKRFYVDLFGWDVEDLPVGGGVVYSMFRVNGRDVGAASMQQDAERQAGIPPHWNVYFSVDDVKAAADRAAELGASVLAPPFEVLDSGEMAVLTDPTGAVFSLWQAKGHPGLGLYGEPGAPSWAELSTPDMAKAESFYADLFGWVPETSEMPNGPYTVFRKNGDAIAGMMTLPMPEIPPNWTPYIEVADCEATAAKAQELGAHVLFGPHHIEGVGTFASLADPAQAVFSIIRSEPPA